MSWHIAHVAIFSITWFVLKVNDNSAEWAGGDVGVEGHHFAFAFGRAAAPDTGAMVCSVQAQ